MKTMKTLALSVLLVIFFAAQSNAGLNCLNNAKYIDSEGQTYVAGTVQEAYDAIAVDGSGTGTILVTGSDVLEDLNFDYNAYVTIEGGYSCRFSTRSETTIIYGTQRFADGTVIVDEVVFR